MPYIHKSGKQFGLADISITNGVQCREITQAQYDALSVAEKNNGTVYFVTDGNSNSLYINDPSPIGAILAYGGAGAPEGWLMCDGSAINRIVYKDLFAVIGTTYGEGDTVTTFNLPNLKGRVAVGADTGYALGSIGGEETHQLTTDELPAHKHHILTNNDDFNGTQSGSPYGTIKDGTTAWYNTNWYTENEGGDQPHNNMQPYVVTNYIIKARDAYRAGGSGGGGGTVDSTAVPAPNMVSEFDDDAKMNSTDMTDAEIESYFEEITYNPMIVNDTVPIGAIQAYGGETAPNNWLICDGSAVSRTTYNKLFAAIGTTYGEGDGETTFNIPDLRGKVIMGEASGYALGTSGGSPTSTTQNHTLTIAEMPSHSHGINNNATVRTYGAAEANKGSSNWNWGSYTTLSIANTGGGGAHNHGDVSTLQPYTVTNYIIKADDDKVTGGQLQAMTDFFYPVGSYYETSDITFNPNVSFGGTWELEVEGQVHISAGTGYTVSGASSNRTDGGATTSATGNHTLTISEMPNHSHGSGATGYVNGTPYGWASLPSTGDHITYRSWTTDSAGGGAAHNHGSVSTMQPYIVVNRWHRTA